LLQVTFVIDEKAANKNTAVALLEDLESRGSWSPRSSKHPPRENALDRLAELAKR
jgi:hypothetical protein